MVGSYLTLFTILVIQVLQASSQDCGDASWTLTSNTCFNLIEWPDMGWPEARQSCVARGGDLASLSTPSIQTAAEDFLRADGKGGENVWIGLYFPDLNGPPNGRPTQERRLGWMWTDNSPYTNPSWEKWEPNEPGGGEPYVRLRGSEWLAIGKGGKFRYALCQKAPGTQAPPPTPQPTPAPTPQPTPASTSSTTMSTSTTKTTTTTQSITRSTTTTTPRPTSTSTQTTTQISTPSSLPSTITTKGSTLTPMPGTPPTGGQADCGDIQWQYIEQNRACYNIQSLSSSIDWERAEAACRDMNGHLATPSTADQHDAVVSMIRDARLDKTDLWIGLQHQNGASGDLREGWKWLDGSPYVFTNWQQNEPGAGERFVRLKDGMWWAISRGSYTDFLCQKDPVFIGPPSSVEPSTQTTEQSTSNVFATPTIAPATPKPPGGSDQTNVVKDPIGENGGQDGEDGGAGGGNITLAALAVLVVPVVFVIVFIAVYLRRNKSNSTIKNKLINKGNSIEDPEQGGYDNPAIEKDEESIPGYLDTSDDGSPQSTLLTGTKTGNTAAVVEKEQTVSQSPKKPNLPTSKILQNMIANKPKAEVNPYVNAEASANTTIKITDLNDFMSKPESMAVIHSQFDTIPMNVSLSKAVGKKDTNAYKNRFKNIIPYDKTRVILKEIPGQKDSDYINASFIDGFSKERMFIAASGPTTKTLTDFWRMLWDHDIKFIFMLTKLVEDSRIKCQQYWPAKKESNLNQGPFVITLLEEKTSIDFITRKIKVKKGDETRELTHYHFQSWYDHGIPHTMFILRLRKKLREIIPLNGEPPIMCHCSAGVGRTGTFLAIDYLLEQAAADSAIDVVKCVMKFRQQRTDMVQNVDQFDYVYKSVWEHILLGETAIPCADFAATFRKLQNSEENESSVLVKQFEALNRFYKEDSTIELHIGLSNDNKAKNRSTDILPVNNKRILLVTPAENQNSYINAVVVSNTERPYAYIATQAPLPSTVVDLWRAVYDFNSCIIIMLCPMQVLQTEEMYFPDEKESKFNIPPFEIECTSVNAEEDSVFIPRALQLTKDDKRRDILHMVVTSDLKETPKDHMLELFLGLHESTKNWQQQHKSTTPVLVHCVNGAEWTGLYLAFCAVIDQIENDQEVDIYHAVAMGRLSRQQFVNSQEQYDLLFELISLYISQYSPYADGLEIQ